MTQQTNMADDQVENKMQKWNQEQFIKIQKFAVSQGIQFKSVNQPLTRCLPPLIGVWYIHSKEKGKDYWVISGECLTDITSSSAAKNAREVLKYFSMNWQLKAENLSIAMADKKQILGDKETQQKFIEELKNSAEKVYQIATEQHLWIGSGLE